MAPILSKLWKSFVKTRDVKGPEFEEAVYATAYFPISSM